MEYFNIAICDDEEYYIEDIKRYIYKYEKETNMSINIYEYNSGYHLIEDMNENIEFNMIFLDVEMSRLSGVDTAKEIRKFNEKIVICFVTSYEDYALDAFAVDAIGYIIKPINYIDLSKVLKKGLIIVEYLTKKEEADNKFISIKAKREDIILDISNIVYIEKSKNNCVFHLIEEDITSYNTLAHIYEELDQQLFCYSHQGFIVNFAYVKEVKREVVCLGNHINVPLSRKFYKSIKERHMDKINRLRIH